MKIMHKLFLMIGLILLNSCNTWGPRSLFGKRSPHEKYGQGLINAGLKESLLGRSWFTAAEQSLNTPLSVNIPYKESGYFPAEKVRATAVRFEAKRGEKLSITLQKRPAKNFTIYIDLWEVKNNKNKKLQAYADTGENSFNYEIDDSGFYIIRLQPELLGAGEYTLTITNGPSLAFPVKNGKIGSFWGDDRDEGARRHEGIDIFTPKGTPALAAADGIVNRVTINRLGGKVVFLRPAGKNYNLYYAHLEKQLVSPGQKVKAGDTLGAVGNTGNAISTSPHLHLGIYSIGGAIDPLPFINPDTKPTPAIKSSLSNIGKSMRTGNDALNLRQGIKINSEVITTLKSNTLVEILAATASSYKVILPDGNFGYLANTAVTSVSNPLRQLKLSVEKPLFDNPERTAARKTYLVSGTSVSILGSYEDFYFVKTEDNSGWISKE